MVSFVLAEFRLIDHVCGRYTLKTAPAVWTQEFLPLWTDEERHSQAAALRIAPRFNIAPTQLISCVLSGDDDRRDWKLLRWGLIPPWADDASIGNRMINARSETAHEKRSFKHAFATRRCLVPADGYYEWAKTGNGRQPFWITRRDGGMLAMAGLWEANQKLGESGQPILSCTILTTSANRTTENLHDRMPVFLDSRGQHVWLDQSIKNKEDLSEFLRPAPDDWLETREVSKRVNHPGNDSPQCLEAIDDVGPPPVQGELF